MGQPDATSGSRVRAPRLPCPTASASRSRSRRPVPDRTRRCTTSPLGASGSTRFSPNSVSLTELRSTSGLSRATGLGHRDHGGCPSRTLGSSWIRGPELDPRSPRRPSDLGTADPASGRGGRRARRRTVVARGDREPGPSRGVRRSGPGRPSASGGVRGGAGVATGSGAVDQGLGLDPMGTANRHDARRRRAVGRRRYRDRRQPGAERDRHRHLRHRAMTRRERTWTTRT
jgi:hypothetical protein